MASNVIGAKCVDCAVGALVSGEEVIDLTQDDPDAAAGDEYAELARLSERDEPRARQFAAAAKSGWLVSSLVLTAMMRPLVSRCPSAW